MNNEAKKMAFHPFRCRLPENSAFPSNNRISLVGIGFASMTLSIITYFRPMPALLLIIMLDTKSGVQHTFFNTYGPYLIYVWLSIVFLILFVGGIIMTWSTRIKKRCPLLIQPWTLLLLYFDVFYWLSLSIYLTYLIFSENENSIILELKLPIMYFVFIYLDIIVFAAIYWIFATYFIMAQLTVIENCYQ